MGRERDGLAELENCRVTMSHLIRICLKLLPHTVKKEIGISTVDKVAGLSLQGLLWRDHFRVNVKNREGSIELAFPIYRE